MKFVLNALCGICNFFRALAPKLSPFFWREKSTWSFIVDHDIRAISGLLKEGANLAALRKFRRLLMGAELRKKDLSCSYMLDFTKEVRCGSGSTGVEIRTTYVALGGDDYPAQGN